MKKSTTYHQKKHAARKQRRELKRREMRAGFSQERGEGVMYSFNMNRRPNILPASHGTIHRRLIRKRLAEIKKKAGKEKDDHARKMPDLWHTAPRTSAADRYLRSRRPFLL